MSEMVNVKLPRATAEDIADPFGGDIAVRHGHTLHAACIEALQEPSGVVRLEGVFPDPDIEHDDSCIECQLTILWNEGKLPKGPVAIEITPASREEGE